MAFFSGWFSQGKEIIARVVGGTGRFVRRWLGMRRGQPPSRGASVPTPPQGVIDRPDQQKVDLLTTGKTETPSGPVVIDQAEIPKTVAERIPQRWVDEMDITETTRVPHPSIFGEPFHYQIEFKISVKQISEIGEEYFTEETKFYTVTSETELDIRDALARGLELAEIDYNTEDPYFGGRVIGVGEFHPVVYTA